jgi:hypothetical protein
MVEARWSSTASALVPVASPMVLQFVDDDLRSAAGSGDQLDGSGE